MPIVDLRLDVILHVVADGLLTTKGYAAFVPRFENLARHGSGILVELRPTFTGWRLGMLWRSHSFERCDKKGSARIAVVGHEHWRDWSAKPNNLGFPGETRFFESDAVEQAEAWLLGAGVGP